MLNKNFLEFGINVISGLIKFLILRILSDFIMCESYDDKEPQDKSSEKKKVLRVGDGSKVNSRYIITECVDI